MQRNGTHKGRGEGAQVLQGVARGKFSKLGARSGPRTRSAHPPSHVLTYLIMAEDRLSRI